MFSNNLGPSRIFEQDKEHMFSPLSLYWVTVLDVVFEETGKGGMFHIVTQMELVRIKFYTNFLWHIPTYSSD